MLEALARLGETEAAPPAAITRTGRLIFGLDLTQSREHSLGEARVATAAMFDAIKAIGRVALKLVYYRGTDMQSTQWQFDPGALSGYMCRLSCESGYTQIAGFLRLVLEEREELSGVVFVGDDCEEDPEELAGLARKLGEKKVPLFVFHECADNNAHSLTAKPVFKRMAQASGGAYVEFKPDSGEVLRELLSSVAAFSAGGAQGVRRMALPQTTEARQLQGRLLLLGSGQPAAANGSERR